MRNGGSKPLVGQGVEGLRENTFFTAGHSEKRGWARNTGSFGGSSWCFGRVLEFHIMETKGEM